MDTINQQIRPGEFCHLSTNGTFQQWLRAVDQTMYTDLINQLEKAEGCGANAKKMLEILSDLLKLPTKRDALIAFLRSNFPLVLAGNVTDYGSHNIHNVFPHYNPNLITIPRRRIITQADAVQRQIPLLMLVDEFCGRQAFCDYIELEGRVYIEYLPPEYANLKGQIPAKNWQVAAYRTKIGR